MSLARSFALSIAVITSLFSTTSSRYHDEGQVRKADRLFEEKKWAEARTVYDQIAFAANDWHSPEARQGVKQAVRCSIMLSEWDDALRRASEFRDKRKKRERTFYSSQTDRLWQRFWEEDVSHLEVVQELFTETANRSKDSPAATAEFLDLLTTARIRLAFDLIDLLDPEQGPYQRSRYYGSQEMRWWWEGVADAEAYFGQEEPRAWYAREGIPLDRQGKPLYLPVPATYAQSLGRGEKVLYLLDLAERLDNSENKDDAARALLRRAQLASRLYGPTSDSDWNSDEFYYRYDERPAFKPPGARRKIKEFWELADDEARTTAGRRLNVLTLPATESPLTLFRLVEEKYPKSTSVAEAIYSRALCYQSRRQFAKAVDQYRRLIDRFPEHNRVKNAKNQIARIDHANVLLGKTGVYSAGSPPTMWFACRNAKQVHFTARQIDLAGCLRDRTQGDKWWSFAYFGQNLFSHWSDSKDVDRYIGEVVKNWSIEVPESDRVATHTTAAPIAERGSYVVEARVPGSEDISRGLVVVTDVAIVHKSFANRSVLWVVDARTGQPLANQTVQVFREEGENHKREMESLTTNRDGVAEFKPHGNRDSFAMLMSEEHGIAFQSLRDRGYSEDEWVHHQAYVATDRPVYRPGSTVQFRIWVRELAGRQYRPPRADERVTVSIRGPQYSTVKSWELTTDRFGSVSGSFEVSSEAALGEYNFHVQQARDRYGADSGRFRVEEYKKPEFEVTVKPDKTRSRLGDQITARVEARYYFGSPLAGGEVHYRVLRQQHDARHATPQEFDWLYGNGFGSYDYTYPWLGDMVRQAPANEEDDEWSGGHRLSQWGTSSGEFVTDGFTQLDRNGVATIRIDPSADVETDDGDYLYTIEAEVRDESRRTVRGTGKVLVGRQEFYASVELDRGWYEAGGTATTLVSTYAADGQPVGCDGRLVLSRISPLAAGQEKPTTEIVRTRKLSTDSNGRFSVTLPLPDAGQFRVTFESKDSHGQEIRDTRNLWVHDATLDGARHRFADLEIIPERRSYKPGDTARLLVHTAHPNAQLLFCDSANQLRFLDVPAHSQVVELKIEPRHVPNLFVQATLVREGRVYTETREVFVPPVADLLQVELQADKETYRPGEKGRVRVKVSDVAGRPVTGDVNLTAYDKAVTYIQDDSPHGPRSLIAERLTRYWPSNVETSLGARLFEVSGKFVCPEYHLADDFQGITAMGGAPPSGGDPSDTGGLADGSAGGRSRRGPRLELQAGSGPDGDLMQPQVRRQFDDTALWLASLSLDDAGKAETEIVFPESLTTWRLRACAITLATQVGGAIAHIPTSKNLLVRLQSPRFVVEHDQVMLSANVHNYLADDKPVTAELIMPAARFRPVNPNDAAAVPDSDGNLHLVAQATIKADGERRFDWSVEAVSDGSATITVRALTDVESDAMSLTIPVRERGEWQTVAQTGAFRQGEVGDKSIRIELPDGTDPSRTQIDVTLAPSPAVAAFDALPFLADYPYGCTEQTMSRFYPTILAVQTLKKLNIDLQAIARKQREPDRASARSHFGFGRTPVFEPAELDRMTRAGLDRLYRFQHQDGGWGWWEHDRSTAYMTAYVLLGLNIAARSGVEVDQHDYDRGVRFLTEASTDANVEAARRREGGSLHERVFAAYVLTLPRPWQVRDAEREAESSAASLVESIYKTRANLNHYGRSLLALALHQRNELGKAKDVLAEILKDIRTDRESGGAYVSAASDGWWHWWNSDVETNAWVLKALVAIDPKNDIAPQVVQWLAGHRPNGHYWRSTRDTALVVTAMADYLLAVSDQKRDCTVAVSLDGGEPEEVHVQWDNLTSLENHLTFRPPGFKPGQNEIRFRKQGQGPLSFAVSTRYLNRGEHLLADGHGIHLTRRYFRITPEAIVGDGSRDPMLQQSDRPSLRRVLLKSGDTVASGETLEVELHVNADANYDYLAFEDMKPAGCEPIQLQSGHTWGDGVWASVELRDERIVFFTHWLTRGEHVLRYRLRAELPGEFHILPARGFAMYTPEIQARSDAMRLRIRD